jgi:hypothetical protein
MRLLRERQTTRSGAAASNPLRGQSYQAAAIPVRIRTGTCPYGYGRASTSSLTMFYSPVAYLKSVWTPLHLANSQHPPHIPGLLPMRAAFSPAAASSHANPTALAASSGRAAARTASQHYGQRHHDSGAKAERQKASTPIVDTLFTVRLSKHQGPLKTGGFKRALAFKKYWPRRFKRRLAVEWWACYTTDSRWGHKSASVTSISFISLDTILGISSRGN